MEAHFDECTFYNATMSGADLERARFSNCKGLRLDDNFVRGATFGRRPVDQWHVLKGAYAGHGQAFHILFSILYFAPIILKISLLLALSTLQSRFSPDLYAKQFHLSPRPIYSLIYYENGFLWYVTTGVLIYQSLRIALTYKIGPLVDQENTTGFSPRYIEYGGYWYVHQIVRVLGFVAIAALAVHSWFALTSTVWLPDALRSP
jgi:hypothetical protein